MNILFPWITCTARTWEETTLKGNLLHLLDARLKPLLNILKTWENLIQSENVSENYNDIIIRDLATAKWGSTKSLDVK